MKTSIIIISLFSVLGLGLFLSHEYEHIHHKNKITQFRCLRTNHLPFPYDYIVDKETSKEYKIKNFDRLLKHTSVQWSNTGLAALPDDVFEGYDCIESIHLKGNNFTAIPDAIHKAPNLRNLFMSHNEVDVFDFEEIDNIKNYSLFNFSLSDNKIKRVIGLPNKDYHKLELANNQIEGFCVAADGSELMMPFDHNKEEITELDLSGNQLKAFPSIFFDDLSVYDLNLDGNKLEGEVMLSGMKRLNQLNMSHQRGRGIDKLIIDANALPNLRTLNAQYCQLKSFETRSHHYNNHLSTIRLDWNGLSVFPNDMLHFDDLSILTLSNNKIRIVDIVGTHQNLSELDLSNNEIKEVYNIDNLQNLHGLNLKNNQLTEIPYGISSLLDLNRLDLSNNKISALRKELTHTYYECEELNLEENRFTGEFILTEDWVELKTLDLSKNDIEVFTLGEDIYELEILDLSYNQKLKSIDLSIFEKADNLREILIIGNPKFDKNNFNYMKKLAAQNGVLISF